jgi:hypothetical protein
MGHVSHEALVVTSPSCRKALDLREVAIELGLGVTTVVESPYNSYYTFLVPTSGSKYGWAEHTEHGDKVRALIARLGPDTDWVFMSYGLADGTARVLEHCKCE